MTSTITSSATTIRAPCPYATLGASRILVSGSFCKGNITDACVIDANCEVISNNITQVNLTGSVTRTFIDGYTFGRNSVDAIGDISTLPTKGVYVANFTKLKIDALKVKSDLRILQFFETGTANIPTKFPKNLASWAFVNQPLNPTTLVNIPKFLQYVDLGGNGITNLTHLELDWTNVTTLYLDYNKITSIANVKFKKGTLKTLVLSNANISHFELDVESYEALNMLGLWQTVDTPFMKSLDYGFKTGKSIISQDAAKCSAVSGEVKQLWSMHFELINRTNFTVCVVSPKTTTPLPTATSTSPVTVASPNTSVIVGVISGVVVVVAALFFFVRRRNRKPDDFGTSYRRHVSKTPRGDTDPYPTDSGIDMSVLCLYRLNHHDVVPGKKLASGAYADVLYGTYKGTPVAIKRLLRSRVNVSEVQGLIDEITLLASFSSPFVVKLVGCCWDQPSDLECVLEYMNAGDLRDNLTARPASKFPWSEKIQVIAAIVDGLSYLHSIPVIHRDLKSRNVLLDTIKPAKLTDFGVSKEDTQETMTVGVGTYRWMAPEILHFNHYSIAADIYSFGVILSELDTHKIPYGGVANPHNGKPLVDTAIMGMVIAGTIQPSFSTDMPAWIRDLAVQCIARNPDDRPTAMVLSDTVRKQIKRGGSLGGHP